ncbi:MAG: hypothetical protein K5683_07900 [Prevotella sp.]|nr:hypothetical protein [Prevotella sp.]
MNRLELVAKTRGEILKLLGSVKRSGMANVIWYLETSDFFVAKCQGHHCFRGGLAVHSLGVYQECKRLEVPFADSTIIIVALLHGLYMTSHPRFDQIEPGQTASRSLALLKMLRLKLNVGERHALLMHGQAPEMPEKGGYDPRHLLQHYIHRCICRDSEHFPGLFDSYVADDSLASQFDAHLYATHRLGIEIVVDKLHSEWENDKNEKFCFYTIPASTVRHHCGRYGLVKHSLEVYERATLLYSQLIDEKPACHIHWESVVLCSLLHDVCKYDEYEFSNQQSRHSAHWVEGGPHGMKTLMLLDQWHLKLNEEEKKAIAWHMGTFTKDANKKYGMSYRLAARLPLVKLIHEADVYSAKKLKKKEQ